MVLRKQAASRAGIDPVCHVTCHLSDDTSAEYNAEQDEQVIFFLLLFFVEDATVLAELRVTSDALQDKQQARKFEAKV